MAFLGEKKVIGIIEDELLFGEFFHIVYLPCQWDVSALTSASVQNVT